jgi:hypothetical protein
MRRLLAALLLLGLAVPAPAANSVKLSAEYSVLRAGQAIGEIKETLAIADGQYRLESTTVPVGVLAIFVKETIKKISSGTHDGGGFRPQQYSYQRSAKPKKNLEARFDFAKQTASFTFDGRTESQPLPERLQDLLSLGYQLRYWPKEQDSLRLPVSNGKKITEYNLQRAGEETLDVPAGSFHTTRYTREPNGDSDGITVWISDQLAAPIKIAIEEKKGAYTEQVLTRFTSE